MDSDTVRAMHSERVRGADTRAQVDDGTWADLDLDQVFTALDTTASPLGKLVLYGWLRRPATRATELEQVSARLATSEDLAAAPGATDAVVRALAKLPRLPLLLVEIVWGEGRLPSLGRLPLALAVLGAAAPLGFFLSMNAGLGLVAGAFVVNMAFHFWWNRRVSAATASIDFVSAALQSAWKLGEEPLLGPRAQRLSELGRRLAPLARATREVGVPAAADDLTEYFRLYFLTRERRLSTSALLIDDHREALRELFERLGELDAAVAVGAFRRAQPQSCIPQLDDRPKLALEDLRHPLLGAAAVPNSVELDGGLVVTGSNMSGKSTFLRAVAINVLFAQSLGFSCARSHVGPILRVVTALRASDRLDEGKSYYLAEAQRIGALVADSGPGPLRLVALDEPFRGTNSRERIAATVAVLRHVRRAGALVLAATHDLEVTHLVEDAFAQGHFQDGLDASGLHFDFKLKGGVATEHNAVRLLGFLGYPQALVEEAHALVARLGSKVETATG